jgi:hypothetical protein
MVGLVNHYNKLIIWAVFQNPKNPKNPKNLKNPKNPQNLQNPHKSVFQIIAS